MKRTYTNAVKLTEDTWRYSSKNKKEQLLEALDYDKSWAETKTIKEMIRRGGKIVARDLKKLSEELLKKHGGKVTINWN